MAFIKRRYLFEADDDNNGGGNANGADQNAAQGNDAQQNAQGSDDAQENNAQDDASNDDANNNDQDQNTDNQDDQNAEENNEDDDDYSIDAEPDEDEDTGDEDNSDDSGNDDSSEDNEDSESEEDKQMDRDMFSTLSEDEQKRKIATLKRLYIELYTNIDSIIEKFGLIDNGDEDENFLPIIKRIMNILYDMKAYISDYILTIFDKASYIENDVTFNRYLSVLDGIKLITDELEKQKESEDKNKK